jgi:phosphoribosyl 1,2-cyclic phosphodiesterase
MNYNILETGSKGNATIIENHILIDCGIPFKKLEPYYKNLKLILLTHIHTDHFNKATIKKLAAERPTLRFGCCKWLINDLVKCGVSLNNIDVYEIGLKYNYKAFQLIPVKLYHDVENCGYRLFINGYKILYATDTRTLEGIVAKDYDLYLVEGNHFESEIEEKIKNKIENNEFAYEIRAKNNHLSVEQCNNWLIENMGDNSSYIYMHQHIEKGANTNEEYQ